MTTFLSAHVNFFHVAMLSWSHKLMETSSTPYFYYNPAQAQSDYRCLVAQTLSAERRTRKFNNQTFLEYGEAEISEVAWIATQGTTLRAFRINTGDCSPWVIRYRSTSDEESLPLLDLFLEAIENLITPDLLKGAEFESRIDSKERLIETLQGLDKEKRQQRGRLIGNLLRVADLNALLDDRPHETTANP